jgi:hypothetical protein
MAVDRPDDQPVVVDPNDRKGLLVCQVKRLNFAVGVHENLVAIRVRIGADDLPKVVVAIREGGIRPWDIHGLESVVARRASVGPAR